MADYTGIASTLLAVLRSVPPLSSPSCTVWIPGPLGLLNYELGSEMVVLRYGHSRVACLAVPDQLLRTSGDLASRLIGFRGATERCG